MDTASFLDACRTQSLSPSLRLMLASDGTLVDQLAALYLTPIRFDLRHQEEEQIDDADADRMVIPHGEIGLKRQTFLWAEERLVLFAVTIFPLFCLPPNLYRDLKSGQMPIGEIIRPLPARRTRLEIACQAVPEFAGALGVAETTPFWTRLDRLTLPDGAVGLVFEVFATPSDDLP
jgi:chorismate-pyruvate lyase